MAEQDQSFERRERAARVYAHAVRDNVGTGISLESLCSQNPDLIGDLEAIHSSFEEVADVHRALTSHEPLTASLERKLGRPVDMPDLAEKTEDERSAPSKRVEKLRGQAPQRSRYRVLGEVARGGMGAILRVWDSDLRRPLAMKVVLGREKKGKQATEEERALARFLEEAQVTGQLEHPGIVPVHELGLDENGRVYFTMRLVRGRELDEIFGLVRDGKEGWTFTRAVSVLLRVAETMAFAHSKGVLHRDLKPGNIMVGRFGEVYVMDWGLARVRGRKDPADLRIKTQRPSTITYVHTDREELRDSVSGSNLVTMDGDVMGTPAYMPPEQARGDIEGLDGRADVYAIGAMMYHLISGHMPYVLPDTNPDALAVWQRVQDGSPEPLSDRNPDAPAELIAICEKSMARHASDRYAGMEELAKDLRSFLEGRVVHAFETGAIAELRKWIKRNRGTAWASAAAVLLALGGLSAVVWTEMRANERLEVKNVELAAATKQALESEAIAVEQRGRADENARLADLGRREAQDARTLAEEEAEKARRERDAGARVNSFLVDLFRSPDPSLARGSTVTAKELLDRGARSIQWSLKEEPLQRARFMQVMGTAYYSLGLYGESEPLLQRALAEQIANLGPGHPDALSTREDLARLRVAQGRYDEAEALLDEGLEVSADLASNHAQVLALRHELAAVYRRQARYELAEATCRRVIQARSKLLGAKALPTLDSQHLLATILQDDARYKEADAVLREVLGRLSEALGSDHPDTLEVLNDLAYLQMLMGSYGDARVVLEQVLSDRLRVLGEDHAETLVTMNDLAVCLGRQGLDDDALQLYEKILEVQRRVLGDDHPDTLNVMNNTAQMYTFLQRYEEAETLFVEALDASIRVRGKQDPKTLGTMSGLGRLYFEQQRIEEGEQLFLTALEGLRESLGPDHPGTLSVLDMLTTLYGSIGAYEKAAPLAQELIDLTPQDDPARASREFLYEQILERR